MQILKITLIYFLLLTGAYATEIDGTWKYEKSAEYNGEELMKPPLNILQIVDGKLDLPNCSGIQFGKDIYNSSIPFQGLYKNGEMQETIDKYFKKTFSYDLSKVTAYFEDKTNYKNKRGGINCNSLGSYIFYAKEKLIFVYAWSDYMSFTKSDGGTSAPLPANVHLYGHKLSQLPFNVPALRSCCSAPRKKRMPQSTAKYAPVYYLYAASKEDKDPLTQLIGTHNYSLNGAETHEPSDYNNPFAHNLHPVFLIFPPLKDVLLASVSDEEQGDVYGRDGFSGALLAIKNGKVTDQLTIGCSISEDYFCIDRDGKKLYQLLESGKFKKIRQIGE